MHLKMLSAISFNLDQSNPLPDNKILDWSKLKALADDKIDVSPIIEICAGKGRKHCGKRENTGC